MINKRITIAMLLIGSFIYTFRLFTLVSKGESVVLIDEIFYWISVIGTSLLIGWFTRKRPMGVTK